MKIRKIQSLAMWMIVTGCWLPSVSQAQPDARPQRVVIAVMTALPVAENCPHHPEERVWTNDDFIGSSLEEVLLRPDDKVAAMEKADTPPAFSKGGAELDKARREVEEEMLATARARQKAYDDTISLMKAKLETETSEFRATVYKQILEDTLGLKRINQQVLERFSEKSSSAEPEAKQPAEP